MKVLITGGVSLCELTALCREIIGKMVAIQSNPITRPNDLRLFMGDCTKLFARTKWRPRRNVRRIVQDVHQWVQTYETALSQLNGRRVK